MLQENSVLVVSAAGRDDLLLRKALNDAGMHVRVASSCAEALQVVTSPIPPSIVFSDASLPDGTWADILTFAGGGSTKIPVVVVSRVVDINFYINALEQGAADFVVPPFYRQDLSHVLSCAMQASLAIQSPAAA
jgi:DNA-binding NtrC family response regulator